VFTRTGKVFAQEQQASKDINSYLGEYAPGNRDDNTQRKALVRLLLIKPRWNDWQRA